MGPRFNGEGDTARGATRSMDWLMSAARQFLDFNQTLGGHIVKAKQATQGLVTRKTGSSRARLGNDDRVEKGHGDFQHGVP